MTRYNNYHRHSHKSNVISLDVVVKNEDYCKRAVELGHDKIFTTEHGFQGDLFETLTLAEQYNLQMVVGAECYYVKDRKAVDEEGRKDRSNMHIILVALNNDGVRDLQRIVSEANIDGYYYKPRIDHELLFSINPKNMIITTACVAGIWHDEELVKELNNFLGENFFLEVQDHNVLAQVNMNKKIIDMSNKYNIPIIHANDSHYIKPEDAAYRDLFLKAKGIYYEEEQNFILDYPDYDTIVKRYEEQGVLTKSQIKEALDNTLVFDKCEPITLINKDIKLPSISKEPNKELKEIINKSWKDKMKNISSKERKSYLDAIRYEFDIIEKTNMADYFILDNKIVELAESKYGGTLTKTGRGSAPSFYSTNLLGLTDIDRLQSPITLFPTRFMSVERILGAKSLPDIDLNTANAEPFIQASKDLLGAENCAWMITWKPLQESSAFRLYCKAIGKDINDYNDIAKEIDKYKDDPYWAPIIKDSEPFIGVIESMAPSPCSMCLYDKPIKEEIGLIKVKDQMVCLLDGYNCDKYKYLKNDYLTVMVWGIIKDVCDLAGIPIPTIEELNNLLDDKTYDIYAKGLTCSINQADSDYATNLVKRYKPTSPAEMSAFVAIIRPGCASLLDDFIERKPYTTGVEQLDELLEDSGHRMIYQESIMKYLIWLGIDEPGSYDIIKKIAKKKFKEQELAELKEKLIKGWTNKVGKEDGFQETWQVVQDAAKYSFNASHSLSYAYDSLYGAYLKSHYPLEYYTVAFNYYLGDEDRTKKLTDEIKYFNISLNKPKFRYSKDKYFYDKETNSIYKGTSSIKYLSDNASLFLYSLKDKQFDTFTDFLVEASNSSDIDSRQLEILIRLQYFEEFGKNQKLLNIYDKFKKLYGRKTVNKEKMAELELTPEMLKDNYEKETEKQFSGVNMYNIIKAYEKECLDLSIPLNEQISYENEILGYINATYDISKKYCYVLKAETKYSPKLTLYCLCNGKEVICKVNRATFEKEPLMKGDVIECLRFKEKNKTIKTEKGFQETSEKEWWLQLYSRVNNKELNELLGG